jgi:hypothetical protein
MSLNIKLVYKQEIHRLLKLPTTYSELQTYCTYIFNKSDFTIKYLDEEEDEITIACDSDLHTAYASIQSLGTKTLRLLLQDKAQFSQTPSRSSTIPTRETPVYSQPNMEECNFYRQERPEQVVWPRHTCDGCNTKPIVGSRFNCTVCQDFDFCENCERTKQHEHPFIKFLKPNNDQYVNIDFTPENLIENIMKLKNLIFSKKPRIEVKQQIKFDDHSAGEISLVWDVRNCGNTTLPSGCVAELVKGNVSAIFNPIPTLEPGQEGQVTAKIWSEGGRIFGKWKLLTPEGLKIGKVMFKGFVKDDMKEKVMIMTEMGFDYYAAEEALRQNGGDVIKAVLSLS